MYETEDIRPLHPITRSSAGRLYLLMFIGNSSSIFPLPTDGSLVIGRAPEADVRVDDRSVSRQHARVTTVGGEVRIEDLGSHNGVRVNGERLEGTRPLRSGDTVALGNINFVLHHGDRGRPTRPLLDDAALRTRLEEELDRVLLYERTAAVAVLSLSPNPPALSVLVAQISGDLRLMDMVGPLSATEVALIFPELAPDEVEHSVQRMLESLSKLVPGARAGIATAPQAGLDANALIASARAASLEAAPGAVQLSGPELHRLRLGNRSIVVADPGMTRVYEQLRHLAASPLPLPVLIHGETGTGKENAAFAVHFWSSRREKPFVAWNCANLGENLAESQLFGHERGAFSGAVSSQPGLFEQANGGTLFLDEVAELPLPVQAKLLRALDPPQRITRLGDRREREVDVRIVAASNRLLIDEVKAGRFREDLLHRLKGAEVTLTPLRERPRDLALLANAFLDEFCDKAGRPPMQISAAAMDKLSGYAWPGNVRELRNVIGHAVAFSAGSVLEPSHLPSSLTAPSLAEAGNPPSGPNETPMPFPSPARTFRPIAEEIRELERQRMLEALEATGKQTRAAQLIGMPLRTFTLKLKQYGITTPVKKDAP